MGMASWTLAPEAAPEIRRLPRVRRESLVGLCGQRTCDAARHGSGEMRSLASWLVRRTRREHGTVLPLVAMLLVVILGITAFAIDVSFWYFDQRHLQMQADSAVEAAAQSVPGQQRQRVQREHSQPSGRSRPTMPAWLPSYTGSTVASSPITSNNEKGTVSIDSEGLLRRLDGSGRCHRDELQPPQFFSGIFGVHPDHFGSCPGRVCTRSPRRAAPGFCPTPYLRGRPCSTTSWSRLQLNAGDALESLICDGSTEPARHRQRRTRGDVLAGVERLPATQINPGGSHLPSRLRSVPPSCLWEFTNVDESNGYDAGEVPRFNSGLAEGQPGC